MKGWALGSENCPYFSTGMKKQEDTEAIGERTL